MTSGVSPRVVLGIGQGKLVIVGRNGFTVWVKSRTVGCFYCGVYHVLHLVWEG